MLRVAASMPRVRHVLCVNTDAMLSMSCGACGSGQRTQQAPGVLRRFWLGHRPHGLTCIVSGSGTPSVSGSVKISSPASMLVAPKVRKGTRLLPPPPLALPAITMKGAMMPPTRAAWFSYPSTALRTCVGNSSLQGKRVVKRVETLRGSERCSQEHCLRW